ncbi:potassium-transporting ATPase A subunit [Streptomyces sp. BK239]|nr:potassium-transporting ATPase A subunit [Streptomyces sp. BK239]
MGRRGRERPADTQRHVRMGPVKGGWSGVWEPSTALAPGRRGCFLDIDSVRRPMPRVRSPDPRPRPQELTTCSGEASAGAARGVLAFSAAGALFLCLLQRMQGVLPLSLGFKAIDPDQAFNTAVSFVTNTTTDLMDAGEVLDHAAGDQHDRRGEGARQQDAGDAAHHVSPEVVVTPALVLVLTAAAMRRTRG